MSTNASISKSMLIKYAVNIILPLAIAFIPCTEAFTLTMKVFFISTIFAICAFAMETMPSTAVAIMLPVFWVFTNIAKPNVIFAVWQQYLPWVIISGFLLANVLQRTGLLSRVIFSILSKTAVSYKGILIGLAVGIGLTTSLVGSHPVLFATIAYGICVAFEFGQSKASAGVMFVTAVSGMVAIQSRFTAPLLLIGTAKSAGFELNLLGFFESYYYNLPLFLFWIACVALAIFMFKPEKEISGKEYCQAKLAEMGPMSIQEKKATFFVCIYLLYIFTKSIHGLSLEWGMALIPWLMTFPVVGCAEKQDIQKMNFGMIFFMTTCMAIGSVATSLGIGDLLISLAGGFLNDQSNVYVFFIAMWLILFICNFAMTPLAMTAAFTVPFLSIAQTFGIEPLSICYFIRTAFDQVILPYEYANYLIFFGFGVISMKDFIKYMSAKTVLNFVICIGILIPWWKFTGFLYV